MLSTDFKNKLLDRAFSGNQWVALMHDGKEVTSPRCPRQRMEMADAADAEISNANEMIFKYVPKCTVTDFGISSSEDGEVSMKMPLVNTKEFDDGDTLVVEVGVITIGIN